MKTFWDVVFFSVAYIERMGATASREAMRMPISQIQPVSRRAHVGSPLALPWPNTCKTYEHQSSVINNQNILYVRVYPEERNDSISGNSLEEAGRSCQTLKSRPTGGEEWAEHNDPGRGPCQGPNNQVTIHTFPKPAWLKMTKLLSSKNVEYFFNIFST